MAPRRPLAALTLLLAACSRSAAPAPPPTPPAAAPEATPAPAAEPAPTPTPTPPATAAELIREAAVLQPGQAALPLPAEGETAVDPSATFRVVLDRPSRDARLLLLDAADAAVPAAANTEVAEGTVLTLAPSAPLVPGGRYRLRLDGAVARDLHAGDRAYLPAAWELRATGTPPPPSRPAKKPRPRRR